MTRFIIITSFCLVLLACSRPQTIIIDGVLQSKQQLEKLDSSEIFSYSKWLRGQAPPWYNRWNKTTLIVVKTRKTEKKLQKQRHDLLNLFLDSVDNGADILIVQNGILVRGAAQKYLRRLSPDQLRYVDTLELQAAKKVYGSHAKPINLIINTYDLKFKYSP